MSSRAKPLLSVWWLTKRFLPYLHSARWKIVCDGILIALGPLVTVLLLWLMKQLIDQVLVAKVLSELPMFAVGYVLLVAVRLLIDYGQTRIEASITEEINQNVRVDLYRHLIAVSPGSLKRYGVGDLLSHLANDVDWVESLIFSIPARAIYNAISAGYFVYFLLVLSWKLTLCALVTLPILVVVSRLFSLRTRRLARISRRKATAWWVRAEERLGAAPIIQAFGANAFETETFASRNTAARIAALRAIAVQARFALLIEVLGAIGGLLVLIVGAYEMSVGAMTIGALIAFLGSIGSLYSPMSSLAKTSGRLQRAAAGAQRVVELLDAPSLVNDRPGATPLVDVKGALQFSNVRFAYPGGPEILHDVSLQVRPGETVAIVGPNGSGKSTLVALALRLYDPTGGVVSIDGTNLRDVSLDSLRRAVAVVFQEPGLFSGTIGDNIRYGQRGASDERVRSIAKATHVDQFASAVSRGYATLIGPRGSWLSGGQRQRVAVARALLRDSPILLLDEATASVDSEAEQLIQDAVDQFHGQRTILVVSHRLSTVMRADRVVVLQQGKIVETGSPTILQRQQSRFRTLFANQILPEKISV